MNELLKQLIEAWGLERTLELISQITVPGQYFGENFFKQRKGEYADNLKVDILRGDSVILEAIPSGADRPDSTDNSEHKLYIELARFADSKNITVANIKHLRNITNPAEQEKRFGELIGQKVGQMRGKFDLTKEFMRFGAMKGEVIDGAGNSLFKFKDDSVSAFELGAAINPESIFEKYEDDLVEEFGYSPDYMMFADRNLYSGMKQYAVDKGIFGSSKTVKEVTIEGRTCLNWNDKIVRPLTNKLADKHKNVRKYLETNTGLLVPLGTECFQEYYTHAEHMDAIDGAPTEYFSKVEDLEEGKGAKVIAESVCLPVNTRPYAVKEVQWS